MLFSLLRLTVAINFLGALAYGADRLPSESSEYVAETTCIDGSTVNNTDTKEVRVLNGLYLGWLFDFNAGDDLLFKLRIVYLCSALVTYHRQVQT